jgi:para-nitrobenzyl esterase
MVNRHRHESAESNVATAVDRRRWLQQAATLAGGSAAAAALASAGCAGQPPVPTETKTGTAATAGAIETPDGAIVETHAGKIRGFTRNGVYVFKGVPYGDTTAGENRFKPPKAVKPWTDVRPTLAWGPVSPHGPRAGWINQEEQFLYQWDDGFASA